MQECLDWFYLFWQNLINWFFTIYIVNGVSLGAFVLVLFVASLVISNLILIAKR